MTDSASDGPQWADAISKADDLVRKDKGPGLDQGRPPPGQKVVMILVGVLVAVAVGVVSPRVVAGPALRLSAEEQAADLRSEASLLVEQIEAYREEYGRLPDPDVLVPYLDEGYSYRILDPTVGQYEVRRSAGGVEVLYDGSLSLGLWLVAGGASAGGSG